MARNQVWDIDGNLIEDIEVPDIVTTDPDVELANAISAATTISQLKDALLGKYGVVKVKAEKK